MLSSMNRQASFNLTELDLRRANRLNALASLREPKTLRALALLWGVSLLPAAGFFLTTTGATAELRDGMLLFALAVTAVIAFVAVGVPLLVGPSVIRRRFREEKLLRQPVSVSWDEQVFEAEQPGVQNRLAWRDYLRFREDEHVFLLMLSSANFQILPKRALSAAQIEDLRQELSRARA